MNRQHVTNSSGFIYQGNIHPKERINFERGCVPKQLARIARREGRKAARDSQHQS